jgi:glycine/D-amino acid oxidase-like deaminating enzyme/nitrite reductase/ring-hydroxylating ferredoxin subunit
LPLLIFERKKVLRHRAKNHFTTMFSKILKHTTTRIVSAAKQASNTAQMSTYTFNKHMSLWLGTKPKKEYPPLDGDKKYDVAIIGGGITGLTAAYLLKKEGRRVAVLERHKVASCTSGGTTAYATNLHDSSYADVEKDFGKEGAHLMQEAMTEGINMIEQISKDLKIDSEFSRETVYFYTEKEKDLKELKQEHEHGTRAGLNCELIDYAPLPFKTVGALKVPNNAQIHATKYLYGIAEYVDGDGSRIYEDTRVMNYEDGEPCTVITPLGKITCDSVIVATHTPIGVHILHTAVAPYRSYVIACKIKGDLPKGLFWDTEDPYHYIRTVPSQMSYDSQHQHTETGPLLIVGGSDHKTGHPKDENQSYEDLIRYTKERFNVEEIVYKWSAQLYESVDGLPYIGRSHFRKHVYLATGFFGDGISLGSIAAKIMSDLAMGRDNRYAALFNPTRFKPLASASDFLKENLDVAKEFAAGWLHSDHVALNEVKPGEAKIVQSGLHKIAAYRDNDGKLHACSAVCPHMKSIVKWNPAECTWDCPSHGARFDKDGHVLEGPALCDLEDIVKQSS